MWLAISYVELMPGLCMRPAHVLSSSYPLSQLFRLHLFPGCSTFYSCSHFYSISNFGACEAVRHGVVTKALPQHRRNATKLIRPLSSHTLRYSEPWHSPNALITFLIFGSHGKGIASLKNQAQDDATAASTTTSSSYTTLAQPCMYTLEVKKSKFIAAATSVEDEAAALSFLSQVLTRPASRLLCFFHSPLFLLIAHQCCNLVRIQFVPIVTVLKA